MLDSLDNLNIFNAALWVGYGTLGFAALTVLAFLLSWGIRFRLVGVTSFMGVLAAGLVGLGLGFYRTPVVPGAIHYSTVYDMGSTQIVISLPPSVTEEQLTATLQQAANTLFSYGRLGQGAEQMTVRARTVLHPEPGISKPLYLGEVRRSLARRNDSEMQVEIYRDNLAQIPTLTDKL